MGAIWYAYSYFGDACECWKLCRVRRCTTANLQLYGSDYSVLKSSRGYPFESCQITLLNAIYFNFILKYNIIIEYFV